MVVKQHCRANGLVGGWCSDWALHWAPADQTKMEPVVLALGSKWIPNRPVFLESKTFQSIWVTCKEVSAAFNSLKKNWSNLS
jgi:hypothetical protein